VSGLNTLLPFGTFPGECVTLAGLNHNVAR
jgi:hypothetical protein